MILNIEIDLVRKDHLHKVCTVQLHTDKSSDEALIGFNEDLIRELKIVLDKTSDTSVLPTAILMFALAVHATRSIVSELAVNIYLLSQALNLDSIVLVVSSDISTIKTINPSTVLVTTGHC